MIGTGAHANIMNQIFVANPKGGCGKTTIATHFASYFAMRGLRVLLVDHDAQKSSNDWMTARSDTQPAIEVKVLAADVAVEPQQARLVIHDMPAAWTLDKVIDILHPGDRVVIPVLASPTDIKACLRFVMGLYRFGVLEHGISVGLVANRVRKNTRMYRVLERFLEDLELPLITCLRDSQNYVRATSQGQSIFELPLSRVATDIRQWQPLLDWVEAELLIQDYAARDGLAECPNSAAG